MIITKNQIKQLISTLLKETKLVDLTKSGIAAGISVDKQSMPVNFYCNGTPQGRALKTWFEDMVNDGESREKGALFEDIVMYGMMEHLGKRSLKNYVNLNTTFGVADSPAADLGAYVDAGRHPTNTNSISVKLTLNAVGAYETSNTAIANLAAMLYDIHLDKRTIAETPLSKLSDRIKNDTKSQSITHDGKPCKYIEMPLGLLSAKFNTGELIQNLKRANLTKTVRVKIPFMSRKLFGTSSNAQEKKLKSTFGNSASSYFLGATIDEQFNSAIEAIHNLVGIHIRNILLDPLGHSQIQNLITDLELGNIKYDKRSHASALKQYFITPGPDHAKFIADFKAFYANIGAKKGRIVDVPIEILDPAKNLSYEPIQNVLDNLTGGVQSRFKLYYAEPKDNLFLIITPDDPSDKTIYVMNPRNAPTQIDQAATDTIGNKLRIRSFMSSLNHFAGANHVANLYLEKDQFTTPNLKMSSIFSPTALQDVKTALSSRSLQPFSTTPTLKKKYGRVATIGALGSKSNVKLNKTLTNLEKAKAQLTSIRKTSSNEIPEFMLRITQIYNAYSDMGDYIKRYAKGSIAPDSFTPPSIVEIDVFEIGSILSKLIEHIATYLTNVIQKYDEGSVQMIAFGLLLNCLSDKDKNLVRAAMPFGFAGRAQGQKLVDASGFLYENLEYTSDQLAEYINLQIVIGVAELAAILAGKDLSAELQDDEPEQLFDEEPQLVSAMGENKLYVDVLSNLIKHLKS